MGTNQVFQSPLTVPERGQFACEPTQRGRASQWPPRSHSGDSREVKECSPLHSGVLEVLGWGGGLSRHLTPLQQINKHSPWGTEKMSQSLTGHSLQAKHTKGPSQLPSNRKPFVSRGWRSRERRGGEGEGGGGRGEGEEKGKEREEGGRMLSTPPGPALGR